MGQHILAIDQGTTSSRSIIFSSKGSIEAIAQQEFSQKYPKVSVAQLKEWRKDPGSWGI